MEAPAGAVDATALCAGCLLEEVELWRILRTGPGPTMQNA